MKLYVAYCPQCDIGRASKEANKAQKQVEQHALSSAVKGQLHVVELYEVEVGIVHGAPGALGRAI